MLLVDPFSLVQISSQLVGGARIEVLRCITASTNNIEGRYPATRRLAISEVTAFEYLVAQQFLLF